MSQFRSRTLQQEPDAIAIIPEYPIFMVVGTYSLVPEPEGEEDGDPSNIFRRKEGMIEILPCNSSSQALTVIGNWCLSSQRFDFGIYDTHFHPRHRSLLGCATSASEIEFCLVTRQENLNDSDYESLRMDSVGKIAIEPCPPDEEKRAIITQFQFIDLPGQSLDDSASRELTIFLVATTQFGNTKLARVRLREGHSHYREYPRKVVDSQVINIHQQAFDLEAWTTLSIFTTPSTLYILSGGDDSQLLISSVEFPTDETTDFANLDLDLLTPTTQLRDKRTHEAGVVHIRNLGIHPTRPPLTRASLNDTTDASQYLILTGSYDERLRLFLFSPADPSHPTTKFTLQSTINLGGGVWRINILDTYYVCTHQGWDYILLIAAHTAGACIVRLSCIPADNDEWKYEFKVEKWFTEGHGSLVYAVAGKEAMLPGQTWDNKTWDITSTSFYDKKVCEWAWVDEKKCIGVLEESSSHDCAEIRRIHG